MAYNPVKMPANIGVASNNAGGNQGFYTPAYVFNYTEPGSVSGSGSTVLTRAACLLGFAPTNCTAIGVACGLSVVGSTNTTFMPLSLRGTLVSSATFLCSSNATIVGSSISGPAYTATTAWQGQAAQTTAFINNSSGGASPNLSTQILPFVLAGATTRQFSQGDAVGISTSGAMSSVTGVAATIWLRDDNGAY